MAYPLQPLFTIKLRKVKNRYRILNTDRISSYEALLIQIVGQVGNDCDGCKRGNGPFQGCLTVKRIAHGACGNCHYNSERNRCSFRIKKQRLVKSTPTKDTSGSKKRKHSDVQGSGKTNKFAKASRHEVMIEFTDSDDGDTDRTDDENSTQSRNLAEAKSSAGIYSPFPDIFT